MPNITGRLRGPTGAAAPASPAVGEVYYDTVKNMRFFWNGTMWVPTSMALIWDSSDAGVTLPAASVSTPTLPTTFKHLLVAWEGKSANAAAGAMGYLGLRLNGIATASYYDQTLFGNTTVPATSQTQAATSIRSGLLTGSASAYSSSGLIFIPNYNGGSTVHPILSLSGGFTGATAGAEWIGMHSGMYGASSLAITSLTLLDQAGNNLVAGSRFSVYGLA